MMIGIFSYFGCTWIQHNQRGAFHGFLLDFGASDRVSGRRISPNDQHTIGVLQIGNRIGSRAGAKGALHPNGRRGVAHAGAAVNVVRTDDCPDEFLHQVVLFIRTTCRRNPGNKIRTVFPTDSIQFIYNVIVGFVPSSCFKNAIALDERRPQPVGVFVECKSITSFQASMAGIYFCIIRRLNAQHLIASDFYIEIATYAAVSTDGAHFFLGHHRFGLINIGNS